MSQIAKYAFFLVTTLTISGIGKIFILICLEYLMGDGGGIFPCLRVKCFNVGGGNISLLEVETFPVWGGECFPAKGGNLSLLKGETFPC